MHARSTPVPAPVEAINVLKTNRSSRAVQISRLFRHGPYSKEIAMHTCLWTHRDLFGSNLLGQSNSTSVAVGVLVGISVAVGGSVGGTVFVGLGIDVFVAVGVLVGVLVLVGVFVGGSVLVGVGVFVGGGKETGLDD